MKRGQQNIALVLLGIVAIIAIIGLILLVARPTGAYVNPMNVPPGIIQTQELNWDNLVGFAGNMDDAAWCAQNDDAFRGALRGTTPDCYAVTEQYVPASLFPLYFTAAFGQNFAVACFTSFPQDQGIVCTRR